MTAVSRPANPPPATDHHPQIDVASPWIQRWSHLLKPRCSVLDVACGQGRHSQWFAARGHAVCAIDRTPPVHNPDPARIRYLAADIENQPWPLTHAAAPALRLDHAANQADHRAATVAQFGAVIVTNYLWRPLFPTLLASLEPGGVLLYETFAEGNAFFGRPTRPDFLLRPGELLRQCNTLHIVAYEHGVTQSPQKMVQRIAAIRCLEGDGTASADIRCAL